MPHVFNNRIFYDVFVVFLYFVANLFVRVGLDMEMPDGHIIGMDAWAYNIVGSMVDLVHIVIDRKSVV